MRITASIFFLSLFFVPIFGLRAQNTGSPTPCFSADFVKGCAPFTVKLSDCSGADPGLVLYDFGTGSGPGSAKNFTYSGPGKFFITQYINSGNSGLKSDGTFLIEVFDSSTPDFSMTACEGNNLTVVVEKKSFDRFLVDYGDGTKPDTIGSQQPVFHTFTQSGPKNVTVHNFIRNASGDCGSLVKTVSVFDVMKAPDMPLLEVQPNGDIKLKIALEPYITYTLEERVSTGERNVIRIDDNSKTEIILTGRDVQNKTYLYTLYAYDPCSGRNLTAPQVLTAIDLRVQTEAAKNLIYWQEAQGPNFTKYTLFRDGKVLKEFNKATQVFYADTAVKCNQVYEYSLVGEIGGGKIVSRTKKVTSSPVSFPPAFTKVRSTVNKEGKVVLDWKIPGGTQVTSLDLYKVINSFPPQVIRLDSISGSQFTDEKTYTSTLNYCYYMIYRDECNNASPKSFETCPLRLFSEENQEDFDLNWNIDPVSNYYFYLEELDENDSVRRTIPVGYFTNYSVPRRSLPFQISKFRLKGVDPVDGFVSYSNIAIYKQDARIIYPNAFSPNRDGLNDEFGVKAFYLSKFAIQIYDRSGNALYYSEDLSERWDGRTNGKHVPEGVYVFRIAATDEIGNEWEEKGTLTIIR